MAFKADRNTEIIKGPVAANHITVNSEKKWVTVKNKL